MQWVSRKMASLKTVIIFHGNQQWSWVLPTVLLGFAIHFLQRIQLYLSRLCICYKARDFLQSNPKHTMLLGFCSTITTAFSKCMAGHQSTNSLCTSNVLSQEPKRIPSSVCLYGCCKETLSTAVSKFLSSHEKNLYVISELESVVIRKSFSLTAWNL